MITKETIESKLNELYPNRNANIFKDGKANAVAIVDTILSQGFMDCLKFMFSENVKN